MMKAKERKELLVQEKMYPETSFGEVERQFLLNKRRHPQYWPGHPVQGTRAFFIPAQCSHPPYPENPAHL